MPMQIVFIEESDPMARNLIKSLFIFCAMLVSVAVFAQNQPAQNQPAKQQAQQPAQQQSQSQTQTQPKDKSKEPNPSELYSEADRPEDNYLERFHALEICEKLIAENLERIYTLNVITTNFKSQNSEWESDYKSVYAGYKEAVDLYYRRNIIYSRVRLEENKAAINKFYKKISEVYQKDCNDLLSRCADVILELTLGGDSKSSAGDTAVRRSSPETNKLLFTNKMRIRIAYGQMDDAKRAIDDGVPTSAIFHYRIAKGYAIHILEELAPNDNKGKYDVHKADNLNRIMTAKKTVESKDNNNVK
jgi:hypothetical protein